MMNLKLLFSLGAFSMGSASFAQVAAGESEKWTLIKTENNVSVYYEQGICNGKDVLFVHIVNNNGNIAKVNWSLWENTSAKSLEVKANETVSGSCQNRLPMFTLTEVIPTGKSVNDLHPVLQISVNQ